MKLIYHPKKLKKFSTSKRIRFISKLATFSFSREKEDKINKNKSLNQCNYGSTFLANGYIRNRSYILMWEHPWRVKTEGPSDGKDLDGKCVITYDRSKIKDACAVMFHYSALDRERIPWRHYR